MGAVTDGSAPRRMVRFCIQGHSIIYTEGTIVRSRCPVCGSPVDRARPPISIEEFQTIGQKQEVQMQETGLQNGKAEAVQKAQEKDDQMPDSQVSTPISPAAGTDVSQSAHIPQIPVIRRRGLPGQRSNPSVPAYTGNVSPGLDTGRTAGGRQLARQTQGLFLNYFGERLQIPSEGSWIGREGLGKQWFDGNLMISRQHVYVRPDPGTGRLLVNEDKSLNGVFYSGEEGTRVRMDGPRMMEPGDILWIYNIPLRIEK